MANSIEIAWIVLAEESGTKLQAYLKIKLGTFSARQIKQLVDSGNCKINGKVERFSSRLVGTGDRIAFFTPVPDQLATPAIRINLDSPKRILYTDNELIIYDKPAGFSSEDPRLLSFIQHSSSSSAQLVHRLDRDTTGALIFAKSNAVAEAMFALFKERQIKKTYLAIVDGILNKSHGIIDNFLGKINVYQGQTLYGSMPKEKGGLRARTEWKRKLTGDNASLVVCYPETGRTHQLRVHLSGLGHPILGDYQYGHAFKCTFRPSRMLLHAAEISFVNPVTKYPVHVIAKLPADFSEAEMLLIKQKE